MRFQASRPAVQYPTRFANSFPPSLLADRQRNEEWTIPLSSVESRLVATAREEVHALPQAVRFELPDQDKLHSPKVATTAPIQLGHSLQLIKVRVTEVSTSLTSATGRPSRYSTG